MENSIMFHNLKQIIVYCKLWSLVENCCGGVAGPDDCPYICVCW
jgi:hypothetical protein